MLMQLESGELNHVEDLAVKREQMAQNLDISRAHLEIENKNSLRMQTEMENNPSLQAFIAFRKQHPNASRKKYKTMCGLIKLAMR